MTFNLITFRHCMNQLKDASIEKWSYLYDHCEIWNHFIDMINHDLTENIFTSIYSHICDNLIDIQNSNNKEFLLTVENSLQSIMIEIYLESEIINDTI